VVDSGRRRPAHPRPRRSSAFRDDLAERLRTVRSDLAERTAREEENRRLIERMMLDPRSYKYVRVSREDIGERGCGHWHVRPRLGIIGMLMGWWQVKLSPAVR
jgi:hypothetical protein